MKKEITEITFADGTKGAITTETITGRVDVKATYNNMTEFYYAERKGRNWIVKICINGFCNDAVIMVNTKTRSAAISEIIQNVKRNQAITVDSAELPTPSPEPKTEEEEEAAAEHFVKQMSDAEPEYMGIDYMDARRFNNWKELLCDKLYEHEKEHDKIYCNTNNGKIFGWFWNKKGSEQFQRIYGGNMQEIDSRIYFIDEMHDLFLDIICGVETDEITIESQLIEKGFIHENQRAVYIFDALLSYAYIFELEVMLNEMNMIENTLSIQKFYKIVYRELAHERDCEKTLLAFCKDIKYLIERIIADYFKRGENNDIQ